MSKQLIKKWEGVAGPMSIKSVDDKYIKEGLATLLENQERKDFNGNDTFLSEASQGSLPPCLPSRMFWNRPNLCWGTWISSK